MQKSSLTWVGFISKHLKINMLYVFKDCFKGEYGNSKTGVFIQIYHLT